MLGRVIKRIASHPWIYDQIQLCAGARSTYKRLSSQVAAFNSVIVLDLGGGTGLYRHAWPSSCVYMCLDIDKQKIERFLKKNRDCIALVADATSIPLQDKSIDVIVCIAVSHHLTDAAFAQLIRESERVLKTTGTFIYIDAVWVPDRRLSKLLWKYDRGSYPRTKEQIYSLISQQYRIVHGERYTIFHEYILCRGIKKVDVTTNAEQG